MLFVVARCTLLRVVVVSMAAALVCCMLTLLFVVLGWGCCGLREVVRCLFVTRYRPL